MSKKPLQPHIQIEPDARFQKVLTCGAPERAKRISEHLKDAKPVAQNREYHSYHGTYGGSDVLVISHGVGAPGAVICFQELIQIGARNLIRLGTAGGLYDDTQVGDLVVATAAVRKDGVSNLMVPAEFPAIADGELALRLYEEISAKSKRVRKGIILTSDLFYPGLIDDQLKLYSQAGVTAVEMECSALFVTSSLKGARAAAVLALDGNPLKWNEGVYDPKSSAMTKALDLGIEACLKTLASA